MERNQYVNKKDIVLAAAAAFYVIGSVKSAAASNVNQVQIFYPESEFKPVIVVEPPVIITGEKITYSNLNVEFPSIPKLTPRQQEMQRNQNQLSDIQTKMASNPDMFNLSQKNDITMYYPIYKAVADKFSINWYLLWIIHEEESAASKSIRAFNGSTYPYEGAMQIDVAWPRSYIDNASKGLENLATFPQRHKGDWKEIAAAASMLSANIKKYENLGNNKAVLNALLLYCAENQAEKRFTLYKEYQRIFESGGDNINIATASVNRFRSK